MKGTLYICATPIGNLQDITLRALETLREVDLIAAEDTRRTQKLLNHYDIPTRTVSYHEHNRMARAPQLVEKLEKGINIALVSDAGTPGISDPGQHLVAKAIEAGINVVPVPGPSALIAALVVSGLPTDRFYFTGFVPRRRKERRQFWQERRYLTDTLVFYEAPHRLVSSLEDVYAVFGDRQVAVARELTKRFEEVFRGRLSDALAHFRQHQVKGELVIVLEGAKEDDSASSGAHFHPEDEKAIVEELRKLIKSGMSRKDAVKKMVQDFGLRRNAVYQASLKVEDPQENR